MPSTPGSALWPACRSCAATPSMPTCSSLRTRPCWAISRPASPASSGRGAAPAARRRADSGARAADLHRFGGADSQQAQGVGQGDLGRRDKGQPRGRAVRKHMEGTLMTMPIVSFVQQTADMQWREVH